MGQNCPVNRAGIARFRGLSANQVLAATYDALGRSKTKLPKTVDKSEGQFAERLSEARASSGTEAETKAKEESKRRTEELRQKWNESAAKHKAEREAREKEERKSQKKHPRPYKARSSWAARKRRNGFAVLNIGRSKGHRRYPFKTIELRLFNTDIYAKRMFSRAPGWSPFHYLKLPALGVSSDLAPNKIRRRLLIPLRDAKHAAARQIRATISAAFKAGAKKIWLKDHRLEELGQSLGESRRFLRQLRKPCVLVGKSDAQAWHGVRNDWERAGGMTRPDENLILCQTRAVAERINVEIQKTRRNQGRVGLRSIQIHDEPLYLNDRVQFRASNSRTDIENLDQVKVGDLGTVIKVEENRISIRTDSGVKVEFYAKEAPDIRLAYAVSHADAEAATPKKAFILFEGKGAELEYEAIQRRAADCPVKVYVGPELAECFTVEGLRELKHRIGIHEMDVHDRLRDAAWSKEPKIKSEPSVRAAEGHAGQPNETESSTAKGGEKPKPYWEPTEKPDPQRFESDRERQEARDRAERNTARREAEEDRKRKATERKSRGATKQQAADKEGIEKEKSPETRQGDSPFERATELKSYWTGGQKVGSSPFDDARPREEEKRRREAEERKRREEERARRRAERQAAKAAQQQSQGHSHSHSH